MNLEVYLPGANGDHLYCAALMATSRGVVRIGQQAVPYRVDPPRTLIPLNNPPAPTVGKEDIDDRQTTLTPDQADLLADALEDDREAADALVPLGIQVANGVIDQWFDDLPHEFQDYDPNTFTSDSPWFWQPDALPDALRLLADITRRLTETADANGEPPADVVEWARQAILNPNREFTARLCAENPDTCDCRAAANIAWW